MSVRGQRVGQPGAQQALRHALALRRLRAREGAHVHLDARAAIDLLGEQVQRARDAVRPLRMRQQDAESTVAQLGGSVEQLLAEAAEGHLEQHPARARGAVGDQFELVVAERRDRMRLELTAAVHLERDALAGQRLAQLAHAVRQLAHRHVLHVRSGDDPLGAGQHRLARVRERLLECVRAVVHAGEQMAVKVDHGTCPAARQSSS